MSEPKSTRDRLVEMLEKNRVKIAPDLPAEFLVELADIEERYQFDDDRHPAQKDVRAAVKNAVEVALHEGGTQP